MARAPMLKLEAKHSHGIAPTVHTAWDAAGRHDPVLPALAKEWIEAGVHPTRVNDYAEAMHKYHGQRLDRGDAQKPVFTDFCKQVLS